MNYLLFAACAALATYVQNVTGFAFSLILLGLVGVMDVVSVVDAANAATLLVLVNAAADFRQRGITSEWRIMRPAMPMSLLGVLVGVLLLEWLSGNAVTSLRMLLGAVIIICAVGLLHPGSVRQSLSKPMQFALVGGMSGVLAGLFSSGGPPLVYHMYRQPLDRLVVQQCLLLMFAINALLRLVLVACHGDLSAELLPLCASAVPVVYAVTWWQHHYPSRLDMQKTKLLVAALLLATGSMLLFSPSL